MSTKPKSSKKKGRNGFIFGAIPPLIILLMGTLTFGLAFIYGKELRETLARNQKELAEMNNKKRQQRLLSAKN